VTDTPSKPETKKPRNRDTHRVRTCTRTEAFKKYGLSDTNSVQKLHTVIQNLRAEGKALHRIASILSIPQTEVERALGIEDAGASISMFSKTRAISSFAMYRQDGTLARRGTSGG